ncbi:hypothetical protein [Reichenbachiella ulvae]|uniref:Uncharacterized protein n=1 Tax=Reichenbachiella ulvae TaxID=2980104 RepID=A0ABT3CQL1_9BACT|nr:hypothetical protein [Reichenbachiella ulvae]MCV9385986.1 hypothetical protein [Reichenbachiella ulvae]
MPLSKNIKVLSGWVSTLVKTTNWNMLKLELSTFVENGKIEISLNGELILEEVGAKYLQLPILTGRDYKLGWTIRGQAGSAYSISISSPASAEFEMRKVIPKEEHETNYIQFNT